MLLQKGPSLVLKYPATPSYSRFFWEPQTTYGLFSTQQNMNLQLPQQLQLIHGRTIALPTKTDLTMVLHPSVRCYGQQGICFRQTHRVP